MLSDFHPYTSLLLLIPKWFSSMSSPDSRQSDLATSGSRCWVIVMLPLPACSSSAFGLFLLPWASIMKFHIMGTLPSHQYWNKTHPLTPLADASKYLHVPLNLTWIASTLESFCAAAEKLFSHNELEGGTQNFDFKYFLPYSVMNIDSKKLLLRTCHVDFLRIKTIGYRLEDNIQFQSNCSDKQTCACKWCQRLPPYIKTKQS